MWEEVALAKNERRRELVLSGKGVQERVDSKGLDPGIFTLAPLNFLEISQAGLTSLPDSLGNLSNLTSLVLKGNQLTSLPDSLSKLTSLKLVDLSLNKLTGLPDLAALPNLETLNLSFNLFTGDFEGYGLGQCAKLAILELTGNQFTSMGELENYKLEHLMEVMANKNELETVSANLSTNWPALKKLDLSQNRLKAVPGELADFPKLKELSLVENPLKDNRLKKMAVQKGTKSVMEYIKSSCPREGVSSGKSSSKGGKKGKNKAAKEEVDEVCDTLTVLAISDKYPEISVSDSVKEVRPFIVFCLVTDLDLTGDNLKKFISLQTRLHKTECDNRNVATIATHDLDKVVTGGQPLLYTALPPDELKIVPLSSPAPVQASKLVSSLKVEAEALRKEKKRSQVSGLHHFLHLLDTWQVYPCLLDSQGQRVVSFPPVTNSGDTKIGQDTKTVLVEVTSSTKLGDCKKVMDALLGEMVGLLGTQLTVVQGRVTSESGELRVTYPAKTDLVFSNRNIKVVRE